MTREYEFIEENVEKHDKWEGSSVEVPKYTCKDCSKPIAQSFTKTTEKCGLCYKGTNPFNGVLEKTHAVSIYVPNTDHQFSQEIQNSKDGKNIEKMASVLHFGIQKYDLQDFDLIVPPPRGDEDADENHMYVIGKKLSQKAEIRMEDLLYKKESYPSQKTIDDPGERYENVKDKIGCNDTVDVDKVLLIDDVATTCATLHESAEVLIKNGANKVQSIVLGRDIKHERLVDTDLCREVSN